jgi:hypothetical protein
LADAVPPPLVERYPPGAVELALTLVDNLGGYTQRIIETVTPYEYCHRRALSVDVVLPLLPARNADNQTLSVQPVVSDRPDDADVGTNASSRLLVPFLVVKRDVLFDNLDIDDSHGGTINLLSRWEDKELTEQTISGQFFLACTVTPTLSRNTTRSQQQRAEAEQQMLFDSLRLRLMKIPEKDPAPARAEVDSVFDQIRQNPGLVKDKEELDTLYRLCRRLSKSYLLVADVAAKPGQRITIKLSHDTRGDEGTDWSGLRGRLRLACGQRPFEFHIVLTFAYSTRSYHFRMRAPNGMYVSYGDFEVTNDLSTTDSRQPFTAYTPQDGEVKAGQGRAGLPFAHFYLGHKTRLPEELEKKVFASVKCREIPPGSLGLTALLQVAVAATLVSFAFFLPGLLTTSGVSTDIPVLFLALPVAMAVWLQPSLEGLDLQRAPLAARFGLLLSGAFSFAAGLVFILARVVIVNGHRAWWVWGIIWFLWLSLAIPAAIFAGYFTSEARKSYKHYASALEAPRVTYPAH